MESPPCLSVVLPIYNGEKYLQEAVQSVLNQTYENFELIALNDGSTDNSLEILQTFHDYRIRIFTQENQGVLATLRRGIALTRAPLIARMDQDDICLPHRFANQMAFMNTHPEVGVCGGAVILDDNGNKSVLRFPTTDTEIRWQLCFGSPIVHPAVVFRKDIIQKVDSYQLSKDAELVDDYDLWTRLYSITTFANINDLLLILRKHRQNMTATSAGKHLQQSRNVSQRYIQNILKHTVSLADVANIRLEFSQWIDPVSSFALLKELFIFFSANVAINKREIRVIHKNYVYRMTCLGSLMFHEKSIGAIWRSLLKAIPTGLLYYYFRYHIIQVAFYFRNIVGSIIRSNA